MPKNAQGSDFRVYFYIFLDENLPYTSGCSYIQLSLHVSHTSLHKSTKNPPVAFFLN